MAVIYRRYYGEPPACRLRVYGHSTAVGIPFGQTHDRPLQALSHERPLICGSEEGAFEQFEPEIRTIERHELEMLYTYAIG